LSQQGKYEEKKKEKQQSSEGASGSYNREELFCATMSARLSGGQVDWWSQEFGKGVHQWPGNPVRLQGMRE